MVSTGPHNEPGEPMVGVPPIGAERDHSDMHEGGSARPLHPSWAWRIGKIALVVVLVAIAFGLIGATLARFDIIAKMSGFSAVQASIAAALVGGVIGLVALIIATVGKHGNRWPAIAAIVISLVMGLAFLIMVVLPGRTAPPLHDITTNVDATPQFSTLTLREDNLEPFQSIAEWRNAHRTGYPELAPVIIERSPAGVLGSARVLAEERGWEIANVDPAKGTLEATAFNGYLKFRDDVIVQVTPIADGSTRVDMRSVSREGESDHGSNADRITEFLVALAAAN
jgi:hypothetical protein